MGYDQPDYKSGFGLDPNKITSSLDSGMTSILFLSQAETYH